MDRLEDVRVNEMEALAQEAIREPESVWVQRPERRNCGRFGESSIMIERRRNCRGNRVCVNVSNGNRVCPNVARHERRGRSLTCIVLVLVQVQVVSTRDSDGCPVRPFPPPS